LVCLPDVHMWEDRPALWQFEEVGPLKGGAWWKLSRSWGSTLLDGLMLSRRSESGQE
jgi:hypothetical protein